MSGYCECRCKGPVTVKGGEVVCEKCDKPRDNRMSKSKEGFDLPPSAEEYRQSRLAQEGEEPDLERQDMRLSFDGRTLQITVLINTDEEPKTVEKRIQRAANEASNGEWRMSLVSAQVIEGMRAKNFWRSIRRAVRKGKRQAKEGGNG